MPLQPISLACISSILITISGYHFFLSIFLNRKLYRYFSISTLGGSFFMFFAMLIYYTSTPEKILFYHRLRMLSLMVCAAAWLFCVYDIYFKRSVIPKVYLWIVLILGATIPTPLFLSLPINNLKIEILNITFLYHYATPHITYSLFALSLLVFFSYSFFRVALCRNPGVNKAFGLVAFLPGIIAGINDFCVTHNFFKNIMISEYLSFMYLLSVFVLFIREERQNYRILKKLNVNLEEEVWKRTKELTQTNERLQQENTERRHAEEEREKTITELKSALEDVQTLSGLLPICASCKKIRDDKGYWNQIEQYIHDHSTAKFTHSFCPECMQKLYPEVYPDE